MIAARPDYVGKCVWGDDKPSASLNNFAHLLGFQHGSRADEYPIPKFLRDQPDGVKHTRRIHCYFDNAHAARDQRLGRIIKRANVA